MKHTVFIILIAYLMTGCHQKKDFVLMDFDCIIRDIKAKDESAWIFVGDYGITKDVEKAGLVQFMSKYSEYYRFYFCDISTKENEHVNYIYRLENIPTAILVSHDGIVRYILDSDLEPESMNKICEISDSYLQGVIPEFANENFKITDHALVEMLAETYSMHQLYKKGDKEDIRHNIVSFEKTIKAEPYFYNLYLASVCYTNIGEGKKSEIYSQKAIDWFEQEKSILYTYLCMELIKDMNPSELAKMSVECQNIDFGEIPAEKNSKKIIRYTNVGSSPLVIIGANVSCSCVNLEWNRTLDPGESGEIVIEYIAGADKGPFYKTVLLIVNTLEGSIMFSIRGNVV